MKSPDFFPVFDSGDKKGTVARSLCAYFSGRLSVAGYNGLIEHLFAVAAFQADLAILVQHLKIALGSGFRMSDAVGVRAGKNMLDSLGKTELPFFYNLKFLNDVYRGIRSEKRQLVSLILCYGGIFYFDEILVSESLGGQVEAYGNGFMGV